MKFATSTIGSLAIRVLLLRPIVGGNRTISVTHRLDTTIGESRTTIEERRPARSALLLTQQCMIEATGADLDDWRKGLAALGPTLVAMPLWIDALPIARWGERIYEPQKVINFNPTSGAFAIYDAGSLPGSPAYSHYAPLLVGRWKKRPEAKALAGKTAQIDVTLDEASPWTCRIGVHSYGSGWTAKPDWTSPPKDVSEYTLEQIALDGVATREVALDRVNAAARWMQEGDFTFADRLQIRTALSWFVAKRGCWSSWSGLPAWLQPGVATTDTPDTYTARFATDALTLRYINGAVAKARIGFLQEIYTPSRAQAQPAEMYLYQLAYELDPTHPELWTNWDEPKTLPEGTYQPTQLAHQEIVRSLKPQDVKAEFSMAFAAGTLMDDWNHARLFGSVTVTIWKCDPDDPAGTRGDPLFVGDVTNVLPEGNTLQVTAKLFGNLFAGRVPGWEWGPDCQTHVFSTECALDEATHRSTGTILPADLSADGLTLTVRSATGWGGTSYADNWFANGLLRTGSGRAAMRASIMTSTMSGVNLVVTLSRPLWVDMVAGAGQSIQLVPGCSGQYEADCTTKFGNDDNFRGAGPFIPDYLEQRDVGSPKTPKK